MNSTWSKDNPIELMVFCQVLRENTKYFSELIQNCLQVLVLAGLGLGAGVAVGTVGAAIGLASARQEVETTFLVL